MAVVTVKKGDSVSQILKNLGVSSYGQKSSWDAVAQANKLNSKYTIYAGQKLVIPDTLLGASAHLHQQQQYHRTLQQHQQR